MLVKLGGGVYELLQHFVANDVNAVYLARRIHGLTETAKLAASYINAEDDQLKGLQKFLVEIVGFLSGTPQTQHHRAVFMSFCCRSTERKTRVRKACAC